MDALWPGKHHLSDQTSATTRGSHRSSTSSTTQVNGREEDLNLNATLGDGSNTTNRPFKINLSAKFIVAMYALSVIIPFSAAYFFGPLLVFHFRHAYAYVANVVRDVESTGTRPLSSSSNTHAHQVLAAETETKAASNGDVLPVPTIQEGKTVPLTLYTSKMFPSFGSATSTSVQLDRSRSHSHSMAAFKAEMNDESSSDDEGDETDNNGDSDDLHLPAGQHLLVDIKNVDSSFLNSEKKLATAMVDLITESKLTLLSYHCHSLIPIGVSCVGVLLESHVAFHTWPSEGVISMDLFTCGSGKLVPILPLIKQLFGVKAEGEEAEEPAMLWSHKLRGFRDGFIPGYVSARNPLDSDLGVFIIGNHVHDIKTPILSAQTEFQAVDVYEVMDETRNIDDYQKSLEDDGSYESLHPEFFGPNKVLLLDGVIQSTRYGDAPYHESIVHPALITHSNPKRVAIVGGGEGATLREVLKHSTVEQAVMIEIDEGVVDLSRDYLPEWQDCSSIAHHAHKGSAPWCFDDKRADVRFEDAMAYFIDNFGPYKGKGDNDDESKFDVVVMDCLDPNDDIPFAKLLYTSDDYLNSLYSSLTEEGILVVQVGEAPGVKNAADETGEFANRQEMIEMLSEVGFKR